MNKNLKLFTLMISAFVIGFSINNFAMSNVPSKIAVVDVTEVISSSSQVKALKKDQEAKLKDMSTFLEKARKEIAAETDVKKKKSLEEKYTKEFNAKKEAQEKSYVEKLTQIDNTISEQIAKTAKANNYDVVLAKKFVLYGGDDLTEEIKKAVSK